MMPGNIKTAGASLAGRKPVVQSPGPESRLPSPRGVGKTKFTVVFADTIIARPGQGVHRMLFRCFNAKIAAQRLFDLSYTPLIIDNYQDAILLPWFNPGLQ